MADGGNHRVQISNVANPLSPIYVATIGVTGESGNDNAHSAILPVWLWMPATSTLLIGGTIRVQIFDRATRTYVATGQLGQREQAVQRADGRSCRCHGQHLCG